MRKKSSIFETRLIYYNKFITLKPQVIAPLLVCSRENFPFLQSVTNSPKEFRCLLALNLIITYKTHTTKIKKAENIRRNQNKTA